MIRALVVDDHPLMRDAMKIVLGEVFEDLVYEEAEDFASALARMEVATFDIVLLDLCMPGAGGAAAVLKVGEVAPDVPVLVVSHLDEPDTIRQVMACGAAGFVPKSHPKDRIAAAIRTVMDGGLYLPPEMDRPPASASGAPTADDEAALTRRQKAVLSLLSRGRSNKQIARELDISEWTVKAHVSAVLRKLGVNTRVEAVIAAGQRNDDSA